MTECTGQQWTINKISRSCRHPTKFELFYTSIKSHQRRLEAIADPPLYTQMSSLRNTNSRVPTRVQAHQYRSSNCAHQTVLHARSGLSFLTPCVAPSTPTPPLPAPRARHGPAPRAPPPICLYASSESRPTRTGSGSTQFPQW